MPINFVKYLQVTPFTVMRKQLEKELSICYSNGAARKQKALFVEEKTCVLIYFTTLLRKKVKQCMTL